ncbi:tetratricopeptide repeat-containing sensor histidine kinase [Spirosoma areae]
MKPMLLTYFLLCGSSVYSQNRQIDSLKHQLAIVEQDTNRCLVMVDLSFAFDAISHDSAQRYANKSLILAQEIQYHMGEARALERIAQAYWISGDYPKALVEAFKGLQTAQQFNFQRQVARCLNTIGNVYIELNDYKKAISYFKQALKIAHETKNDAFSYTLEANLAKTYQSKNQLDSAWYFAQKSYPKDAIKYGHLYSHYIYTGFASIQFDRGNYREAFANIRKSVLINKTAYDQRLLSAAYNQLARFFRKLNQPDSAIYYAKAALATAQQVGVKRTALEASTLLAEMIETKSSQEALYYYKIVRSINEDLYGSEKVLSLQRIIADEQERQRTIEVERVAYQNKLKQYSLLTGLGALLLIAFILYRNNRQKHLVNTLLHEQKAKVESTLSQLKTTQTQLIQAEKMASLGELTAGIAHEIQNPLNFVNNFAEVSSELVGELREEEIKPKRDPELIGELLDDLSQNLVKITHHGGRASAIVKGMLEHSRTTTGERQPTDLNVLADEYLRLAYQGLRAKDKTSTCELVTDFDPNLGLVEVVPQEIGRVLLNLYNNAFYAVQQKQKTALIDYQPTVTVSTAQVNGNVEIRVKDNGIGISEALKAKIFQPFFTTKPTGQGTGLGLSLSYDIITKGHGGSIEVKTQEGHGTEMIMHLPKPSA